MRETANFGEDNLLAIKLLLALCVRKDELLGARWEEFDLDGNTTRRPAPCGINSDSQMFLFAADPPARTIA